jgi:hypothetical protein
VLQGLDKVLYQACDAICDVRQLAQIANSERSTTTSVDEIHSRLDPLVSRGLLLRDGFRYLALAIPLGEYSPDAPIVDRFYRIAVTLGRRTADRLIVPLNGRMTREPWVSGRQDSRARNSRSARRRRLKPDHFGINEKGELEIQTLSRRSYN